VPSARIVPVGTMNIGKLSEIKQVIVDLADEGEPLDETA
jgi:hypothetical protein